ncbi:MAG: tRNA pseudouridine(55) synthase TruB [Anaerolineales bacterium]|nr:tRNA pseudouridine(55) synthase TruB [Anaerolineales bacterium]
MVAPRGILLVDKPTGPTSHDLVAVVRRGARVKRVGHAGTLDPLATGLLVICVGAATRLSEYLASKDKRYTATLRLGQTTDTYDAQGAITSESAALPDQSAFSAALAQFRGAQQQTPPAYSAIKRGGQRAYDLARRGEVVALEPRAVHFYALEVTDWQPPLAVVEAHCSAGTYLRSLAHDLGQALGCGAHLAALRRTASGALRVDEAVPLAALQAAFAAGDWAKHLRPPDSAVPDWPAVRLSAAACTRVQQGQSVPLDAPGPGLRAKFARAYNPAGEFFAVLRADPEAGVWRPDKVFADH